MLSACPSLRTGHVGESPAVTEQASRSAARQSWFPLVLKLLIFFGRCLADFVAAGNGRAHFPSTRSARSQRSQGRFAFASFLAPRGLRPAPDSVRFLLS